MANFAGTASDDLLEGGAAGDVLEGGAGRDSYVGGDSGDLFVLEVGDSDATSALGAPDTLDMITDWTFADRLLFIGADPASPSVVLQGSAASYDAAYALAMDAYATQGKAYAVIQVDADVFVFAMKTDQAVKLAAASAGDVDSASFTTGVLDATGGLVEMGSVADDDRTLGLGADAYDGDQGSDTVDGGAGSDTLSGGDGDDRMFGGADDDHLLGGGGANYLRGDGGGDLIEGDSGFDDINGNAGNDLILAGAGDDWVRGGKGDDAILGQEGSDLMFGDLGDDTMQGGLGDDQLHGGQGNDFMMGSEGQDTLSGEAGYDVLEGGLGADAFRATSGMDYDWVSDFNAADGDHVVVEAGATYTVYQAGQDTVVELEDGSHLVLVRVDLATLPEGWITGG